MSGIKPMLFYSKKPKDVQTVIPTNAVDSGDDEESDFEDRFRSSVMLGNAVIEESPECSEDDTELSVQFECGGGDAEMEAPSTSNHNINPATQSNSGRPIRSIRRQCLPLLVDNMPEENGYSSGSEEVVPQLNVRLPNRHRNLHVWRRGDILETRDNQNPNNIQSEDDNNNKSPLDYFSYYFDEQILEYVSDQSNLYSVQKEGFSINTNPKELQAFLSILIYMGICKLPSVVDYWAQSTRIDQIATILPLKRFKKLRSTIHFSDNTNQTNDRFAKIRPLINHIREKCKSLKQETKSSIDETMIPYKGTRASNLRQYMKGKPHKWGFKFFVRAGVSGIVYDILPYCGSSTFDQESLTSAESNMGLGAKVVISVSKSIPNPSESVLYFDNFFTSIHLLTHLKENMDILALGTLRKNRIEGCPLLSDKDLKKRGRGSYDHRINGEGIIVVKWVDNKAVCLASTAGGIRPTGTAQRYDKDAKAKVPIPCPRIIQLYNEHMGGVDLSDMLVELYRIPSRARRWYFAIFCYLIDLAIVNAWLQYRRDNSSQTKVLDLKHFRLDVSQGLAARSTTRRRGRPSFEESPAPKKQIKKPSIQRPHEELRFDGTDHWPVYGDKGRCRNCTNGYTTIKCSKCNMLLCFTSKKNCFVQFHKK